MKLDLFRPKAFLIFYSIFLGLAAFTNQNPLSFLVVLAGFPLFILGTVAAKKVYGKEVSPYWHLLLVAVLLVVYPFIVKGFIPIFYSALVIVLLVGFTSYLLFLKYLDDILESAKIHLYLLLFGIVFLFITLLTFGGIPLLNPELKKFAINNAFWGTSMLFTFLGFTLLAPQIKKRKQLFLTTAALAGLFALTAFRAEIVIIILIGALVAYYSKKLDNKSVLIPLIAIALIVVFIGSLIYSSDPMSIPVDRAGVTFSVFDQIVEQSFPFGVYHGTFFLHGNPRLFVATELAGYSPELQADITHTFLGAPMLDFGILGVFIAMLAIGFVLQLAYSSMKKKGFAGFYPFLFALSLVWIEIGIDQFQVLFFILFLLFYLIKNSRKLF